MADSPSIERGALLVFPPDSYYLTPYQTISFDFNPEGLTRSVVLEDVEGEDGEPASQLKETLTLLLRFDISRRSVPRYEDDHLDGLRVEMAALEQLMYPYQSLEDEGIQPSPNDSRADVILVWGSDHHLPVRVVGMKFDELQHNNALAPTRVEVELELEVVFDASDETKTYGWYAKDRGEKRRQRARRYYGVTT